MDTDSEVSFDTISEQAEQDSAGLKFTAGPARPRHVPINKQEYMPMRQFGVALALYYDAM